MDKVTSTKNKEDANIIRENITNIKVESKPGYKVKRIKIEELIYF
jgi:hypothetical protein